MQITVQIPEFFTQRGSSPSATGNNNNNNLPRERTPDGADSSHDHGGDISTVNLDETTKLMRSQVVLEGSVTASGSEDPVGISGRRWGRRANLVSLVLSIAAIVFSVAKISLPHTPFVAAVESTG